MVDRAKLYKVTALPQTLEPNSVYLVKNGTKFDILVSNKEGTVLYEDAAKNNTTYYNQQGKINSNVKEFITTVDASSGTWSVDYTHVGFTQILNIQATGLRTGSIDNTAAIASVDNRTITLTGCSGEVFSKTTVGLLAVTQLTNSNGKVSVRVIGI